jgi:hypothetical protein
MERLLLGGLLAIAGILLVSAVIATMAPVIAVGVVLYLLYRMRPRREMENHQPAPSPNSEISIVPIRPVTPRQTTEKYR